MLANEAATKRRDKVFMAERVGLGNLEFQAQDDKSQNTPGLRQVVCLGRNSASLLPLLPKKGGEGGERRPFFISFPSLRLSLVPRGERGKNVLSLFHAEHH